MIANHARLLDKVAYGVKRTPEFGLGQRAPSLDAMRSKTSYCRKDSSCVYARRRLGSPVALAFSSHPPSVNTDDEEQ